MYIMHFYNVSPWFMELFIPMPFQLPGEYTTQYCCLLTQMHMDRDWCVMKKNPPKQGKRNLNNPTRK